MTTAKSKREYAKYHSSAKAKADRAARNRARYAAEKAGKVKKGDGKEVDHKKPLSKGGSRSLSNTRVVSKKANRQNGVKCIPKSALKKGGRMSKPGARKR